MHSYAVQKQSFISPYLSYFFGYNTRVSPSKIIPKHFDPSYKKEAIFFGLQKKEIPHLREEIYKSDLDS